MLRGLGLRRQDETLDRRALRAVIAVIGLGTAFLSVMVFVSFPEWISPRAFAPGTTTAGEGLAVTLSVQHRWGPYSLAGRAVRPQDPAGPAAGVEVEGVVVEDEEPFEDTGWPPVITTGEEVLVASRGSAFNREQDFGDRREQEIVLVPLPLPSDPVAMPAPPPPDPVVTPAEPVELPIPPVPGTPLGAPPSAGGAGQSQGLGTTGKPSVVPPATPGGPPAGNSSGKGRAHTMGAGVGHGPPDNV